MSTFEANPVIAKLRREREATIRDAAKRTWAAMDQNQKTGVRFGLFPAEIMRDLEAQFPGRDAVRMLSVALMECASKDGGMRA